MAPDLQGLHDNIMAEQSLSTLSDKCVISQSSHQRHRSFMRNIIDYRVAQQQTTIPMSTEPKALPTLLKLSSRQAYWELTEIHQEKYKNTILPEVNCILQTVFDSDQRGELFSIVACMVGKSQERAKPTIFLIGDDGTCKRAKITLEESPILTKHPGWEIDYTPNFPNLPERRNDASVLRDVEFWSADGTIQWREEGYDPVHATDVYYDLSQDSALSTTLPVRGLAIYVKHPSSLRLATANLVRLGDRIFLQTVYHTFHPSKYMGKPRGSDVGGCHLPAVPSVDVLAAVGRLLVWSLQRDWALIEVFNEEMISRMSRTLAQEKGSSCVFQRAGRPSNVKGSVYTWTASSGELEIILSETTTYMKLPNSNTFEEVHRARLVEGSWSNGDSGAVIYDPATGLTFGHVLGGNQATGDAVVLAADQVIKDFSELDFPSHLSKGASKLVKALQVHHYRYLVYRSHVQKEFKLAYSHCSYTYVDEDATLNKNAKANTSEALYNEGNLYAAQGKLDEAEQFYQLALTGYEMAWGQNHTLTLNTLNKLGILYTDQGKLGEAEQMFQRALERYEKAWGLEHPSTLDIVNNLGTLYAEQGKLGEAEQIFQRALEGTEKEWGLEHPSTLDIVNNLGTLCAKQGKLDEAEQMLQRALEGYEKALGRDCLWTLMTVNNLGVLYENQGKLDQADKMYERASRGREEAVGSKYI